ncbi:MAG: CBS domain-containing protein [Oligoflexia bacterium]|nr:CBS domain-containing protein [Oligoflexia bacterium]
METIMEIRETIRISQVMTSNPAVIDAATPLTDAMESMRRKGIRHFPVMKHGKLVGVVSDRDLKYALRYPVPGDSLVEHVMSHRPFVVGPEAPVDEVVSTMAERRYGSAVVQGRDGAVLGIFTTVDALRFLGNLTRQRAA